MFQIWSPKISRRHEINATYNYGDSNFGALKYEKDKIEVRYIYRYSKFGALKYKKDKIKVTTIEIRNSVP
jgi:hypothetical protein